MNKGRKQRKSQKPRLAVQPFGTAPLLPSSRVAKLAYNELVTATEASVGAGATYTFSLNSLFDPNSSGTGAQPVGFDQIMAMYGQFRVLSARVKVVYSNSGTVNETVGMFATFQPAFPANPAAWPCQPYGIASTVENSAGRSTTTLMKKFDIPTVLGLTKAQYLSDMDFVGTAAGNPTRQAYLVLWIRSLGASAGAAYINFSIEYDVQFSQPQAMSLS
jgi:hypothetical protein